MKKLFFMLCIIIPLIAALAFADTNVTFEWEGNLEIDEVTHYNIYRSDDGQKTWNKINDDPIAHTGEGVTHTWTDQNVPDGLHYWYATAVNRWNMESDPSDIISAQTGKPSPPKSFILKLVEKVAALIKSLFRSFRIA